MKIFFLAAGFGTRLLPITKYLPKPLLPIAGKPLLQIVMDKCLLLNPQSFIVNTHYKHSLISDFINKSPYDTLTSVSFEPDILGTGGALKNNEALLKDSTFLVHNSDIYSDLDLSKLLNAHQTSSNIATLAVLNYPQFNNVVVNAMGNFLRIHTQAIPLSADERLCAFMGIAVYEPDFLKFINQGVGSVIDGWVNALQSGAMVGTVDFSGCYFNDIGTVQNYAKTVFDYLYINGESFFIHHSVKGCNHLELSGFVSIEKDVDTTQCKTLKDCIVLPETTLLSDEYSNCIVYKDTVVSFHSISDNRQIGTGGSYRKYFRISSNGSSIVKAKYSDDDPDMHRHIQYSRFFKKHKISVPEVYSFNPSIKEADFEDVGDMSLYTWTQCKENADILIPMYQMVLDEVIKLHHIDDFDSIEFRIFDYQYFRWETDYFLENFIKKYCGIEVKNKEMLLLQFHEIAQKADSFPKKIIHRDLQSQNIFIKNGIVKLIDYQGARIGPPAYDIASLIYDPYVQIKEDARQGLIDYYVNAMSQLDDFDKKVFKESLHVCRLQRHMQALGAYAFLTLDNNKRYFSKHIPNCLEMLAEETKGYTALREIITKSHLIISKR